jgi:ubiquinone/menaquinone biosynthesis C-methylase UbiE
MGDRRAYFESLAPVWDELQPPNRDEVLVRLLAPFHPLFADSLSILEVGTGTGALIPHLRELAPGARIVSFDVASGMVRRARARCPEALLVQADAELLPFAPAGHDHAGFNLVVCHNTFPHFVRRELALVGISLLIRHGGHLLILHDLGRESVNAIHRARGYPIAQDLLPPASEMVDLLARAGFAELHLEDADGHYLAIGRWGVAAGQLEAQVSQTSSGVLASL